MRAFIRGVTCLRDSLGELLEALLAERARRPVDIDTA